jgi:hypothetical protein
MHRRCGDIKGRFLRIAFMTGRFRRVARRLAGRRPIVCVGHSHIDSVEAAAASAGVALEAINFWRALTAVSFRADGSVDLIPEVRSRLIAPVFSFVGGAVHHDIGLFVHSRPYDFVLPERQDLPLSAGAELIPYDAVHAAMQARTRPYLEIMAAIRAAARGSMFHVESPPIYRDEVVPPKAPVWMSWDNPQISPAWFRYKLWQVHSGIVRAYCRESGITFIPHPPEAVDAQGFLAAGFYSFTAHVNPDYGALVLRQMQELLRAARRTSAQSYD